MTLSDRSQQIKPSPTLAIAAMAKQMQAEGKNLINLSVGEPDFDTPEFIKDAAIKALKEGKTKYTPADGILELKHAIIQKFEIDNQLRYSPKEVMATNGCKQALCNTILALINPGDEVIIPTPYWVSYPDMVLLAEGKPVYIETTISQHFKITAEQLSEKINAKTKLLIINSPSNPSGMMYAEAELKSLADVLLKHPQVFIISDDMYEHIHWSKNNFKNIINVCPELRSRTIICHGVSKTYAMTGWRLGYAAGPQEIINAMTTIQSQSTSNPNSITQYAAIAALMGDQSCVKEMCAIYHTRHEIIYAGLNKIKGIRCAPAEGAFYSFPDVSEILQQQNFTDIDFSQFLLHKAGVVVIPGSAFGSPHCIRISFAAHENDLKQALIHIDQALSGL